MRPTHATVDLARVAHNVRSLRALTATPTLQMAVVKADAYGHGAVPVARSALAAGASWLGVALVEEGLELRRAAIAAPLLVLGAFAPEDVDPALSAGITLTVFDREQVLSLSDRARALGQTAPVHLKIDTGMGRLGIPAADALAFTEWLVRLPGISLGGVFSHFATADETDLSFARRQLETFLEILAALDARGIEVGIRHMANTAATMVLPESHLDLVRNGIGIYGLYPSREVARTAELRPALSLRTAIAFLKAVPAGTPLSYGCTFVTDTPSRIATLPVGYGDGYPRLLSNRGSVLVGGARAPLVGRVCMDMILADVSSLPGAAMGDPVVLIGEQGDQEITADELAELSGTINYEITCNVGRRVPRVYEGEGFGNGSPPSWRSADPDVGRSAV